MKPVLRDTDYAMRALMFMGKVFRDEAERLVTVEEIISRMGLPERFMRRILQKLAKAKVLSSRKGKKGGFSFLKHPDKVSLKDVVNIFQGGIDLTNCVLKGKVCPDRKRCVLRKRLRGVNSIIDRELRKITLSSLLKEAGSGKEKNR